MPESTGTVNGPVQHESPKVDELKLKELLLTIQSQQNFGAGLAAGAIGAVGGAIAWAVATALTGYQIGWMAVGVGFLVGLLVRQFGKGIDKTYGYLGGALSLVGCMLGNFLTVIIFVARENGVSFFQVLSGFDYSRAPGVMLSTFQPMDLLFYGLAVYEGYKFSFRRLTPAELGSVTQASVSGDKSAARGNWPRGQ